MNSSKLIVAAAAITVFGVATSAFGQSTSTENGQRQGTMPQNGEIQQNQTTTQNQGSTNRSSTDRSLNRVEGSDTSGMGSGMANRSDGSSSTTERAARADRN